MTITIKDLDHIEDAAREFIGRMGDDTVFAFYGKMGAGKTTFIKLLCRLYDVTEGRILIDGTDIREYSNEEYRKLFAVVFQDFQLFAFSLKDNIAMGRADEPVDDKKVEEALKLSGLYDDAVALDEGLDTRLFKSFDEHGTRRRVSFHSV